MTEVKDYDLYDLGLKAFDGLIRLYLQRAANEQYSPDGNVDHSDSRIKDNLDRAVRMRKLREQFEEIVTGAILEEAKK